MPCENFMGAYFKRRYYDKKPGSPILWFPGARGAAVAKQLLVYPMSNKLEYHPSVDTAQCLLGQFLSVRAARKLRLAFQVHGCLWWGGAFLMASGEAPMLTDH